MNHYLTIIVSFAATSFIHSFSKYLRACYESEVFLGTEVTKVTKMNKNSTFMELTLRRLEIRISNLCVYKFKSKIRPSQGKKLQTLKKRQPKDWPKCTV